MTYVRIMVGALSLFAVTVSCSGCLAVLAGTAVGGAFYHDSKKKQSREQFMADFRATNLEREKAGLEPLDLCSEKYQYDKGWAKQDPVCRERMKRYERGDESALDVNGTAPDEEPPTPAMSAGAEASTD